MASIRVRGGTNSETFGAGVHGAEAAALSVELVEMTFEGVELSIVEGATALSVEGAAALSFEGVEMTFEGVALSVVEEITALSLELIVEGAAALSVDGALAINGLHLSVQAQSLGGMLSTASAGVEDAICFPALAGAGGGIGHAGRGGSHIVKYYNYKRLRGASKLGDFSSGRPFNLISSTSVERDTEHTKIK